VLANHRRQLKPVEIRHADVDQHDRDIGFEQLLQRLVRRAGLDQVIAELAEDHLIAKQLSRLVVDQQNVDLILGARIYSNCNSSNETTEALAHHLIRTSYGTRAS
jgi:uncharacterized protein YihD (DUF1040 family)